MRRPQAMTMYEYHFRPKPFRQILRHWTRVELWPSWLQFLGSCLLLLAFGAVLALLLAPVAFSL